MEPVKKTGLVNGLWWIMQVVWYLTLAFTVFAALVLPALAGKNVINHLPIPVDIRIEIGDDYLGIVKDKDGNAVRGPSSPLAEIWGDEWGNVVGINGLVIHTDKPYVRSILYGSLFIFWPGLLVMVWLLRKLVLNVRRGEHFSAQNPRLIKWIGYLWLLGSVGIAGGEVWLRSIFSQGLEAEGIKIVAELPVPIPYNLAIPGLVILMIGQLMAEAVKMKEEADLTI
jgi:hypothetical protein